MGAKLSLKSTLKKAKRIILDIISFSTPQAVAFNLLVILAILAAVPTKTIAQFPAKCIFKHYILPVVFGGNCPATGIFAGCQCPGCGMTRALSSIIHGDLHAAWGYNKIVFIVLPVMLALIAINTARIAEDMKKK